LRERGRKGMQCSKATVRCLDVSLSLTASEEPGACSETNRQSDRQTHEPFLGSCRRGYAVIREEGTRGEGECQLLGLSLALPEGMCFKLSFTTRWDGWSCSWLVPGRRGKGRVGCGRHAVRYGNS
jgi:hypothetical protein